MARSTGKQAFAGHVGTGITNLITAIADAKLDSVPLVAITGQVTSTMIGTDAFQEVDTFGMTMNITKHNYLVKNARELPRVISDAFSIAENGRPGPVLIDVPKDVQLQESIESWPEIRFIFPSRDRQEKIREIANMINERCGLLYTLEAVLLCRGGDNLAVWPERILSLLRSP
jgi:acetolactate synthase-1/2/3 large subunit